MSLKKLNLPNLLESIALVESTGCHAVWVTDRFRYWQRDIDKWVPQESREHVSIASRSDFVEYGLPSNTGIVLVDGKIDVTGDFRLRYATEAMNGSPRLQPQPTLDTDLDNNNPQWWSKPITESEVPY